MSEKYVLTPGGKQNRSVRLAGVSRVARVPTYDFWDCGLSYATFSTMFGNREHPVTRDLALTVGRIIGLGRECATAAVVKHSFRSELCSSIVV